MAQKCWTVTCFDEFGSQFEEKVVAVSQSRVVEILEDKYPHLALVNFDSATTLTEKTEQPMINLLTRIQVYGW